MGKNIKSSGYIAIVTAIIISVLIVVMAFTISLNSFIGRANILDSNFKEVSRALSEACFEEARLKLAQNSSYSGNEIINIGSDSCDILSVSSNGSQYVINTQAQYQDSYTDLIFTINSADLSLVSWQEVGHF